MGKKPKLTFLICGSGKAGTTWIHACCEEHKDICVPIKKKEIHYFSKYFEKGYNWYNNYFVHYSDQIAVGEICPTYFYTDHYPGVAERIYLSYPDIKIILILRHPIEKAYSDYRMFLRAGKVSDKIESVLIPGWEHIETAKYYHHLSAYLKYFPKNNIHILFYDDLLSDPYSFIKTFFNIIGVDDSFVPTLVNQKYHVTKDRPKYQNIYNNLVRAGEWLSNSSLKGARFIDFIRKRGIVDIFHNINKGDDFPTLSEKQREQLLKYFYDEVKKIELFSGRKLDNWFI